ncbi:hypothetical protein NQ317_002439 [Molorchus minor]|uniref:RNase H type-1 domain-containing protein n=1 Tax=Molorchus minor TaxID=1323400 RepID=A0ABQ9IWU9_9CUCU|nr:hypothetical protein NQ317_002439 [Molorchus minor]
MPGMHCAVAVCNNSWEKVKRNGMKIPFHRFPRDCKRQKIWVNACRRNDDWNPKVTRQKRFEKRQNKKIVKELLLNNNEPLLHTETEEDESLETKLKEIVVENNDLKERIIRMQHEIDLQRDEITLRVGDYLLASSYEFDYRLNSWHLFRHLVILVKGNEWEIINSLQDTLDAVSNWCEGEQMSVNPHKTVIVPFTRKRKLDGLIQPSIMGETIAFSEEVKYLGVTLDKTMTWNSHLDKVIHKAKMSFWTCRRICGKSWGIGPQQMYWIYTTIIRPMIAYGSIVWWSKGLQRTARTKLSGLQRLASLAITGALRTTPSAAMEILLDLPPLHIFMEREARWATYRLHQASSSMLQATTMEQNRLIDDIKSHSILSMPSDVMPSRTSSNLYYKVLFPKRDEWECNKDALQKADSCWFTDGSKTPEGTGAGVHSCNPRTRISVSLGTNATVFQAEVYAIELCMGRLEQMNPIRRTIKIFSDSQAALKALVSYRCNSKTVWNCQKALNNLSLRNHVTLVWIPGHSGQEGNEIADSLARKGAETTFIGPEPVLGISYNTAKMAVLNWSEGEILQYWQSLPGNDMFHTKWVL